MTTESRRASLELLARIVLGGVFVYAAVPKILDPVGFSKAVYAYQILPVLWSNVVAASLPWMELFAGGVLLASGFTTLGKWALRRKPPAGEPTPWVAEAALVTAGLLIVFIVAISIALAKGVDISCGCFGTSPEGRRLGWSTLAEDALLLLASVVVLRRQAAIMPTDIVS